MFWPASDSMQGAGLYLLQNQRNDGSRMPGPYLAASFTPAAISINLNVVTVTASARSLTRQGRRNLQPLTVVAAARPLRPAGSRTLGRGQATVSLQPIPRARGRTLQVATVTSQPRPLRPTARLALGTVTTTASALAITPGGTHTDRVPGHFETLGIGHLTTASPGRTIGPRIGHLED